MQVVALDAVAATPRSRQVALGFFDGLHRGHQAIIARTIERARERGLSSALFTFRSHPLQVLRPASAPPALTTFDEKITVLSDCGLDHVIWHEFTAGFSHMSPEAFVQSMVVDRMGASGVVAGPNYRFGEGALGDVGVLRALGERFDLEVEIVSAVEVGRTLVSSTRIRALIARGAVTEAAALLGRTYGARAEVVHGDGRGRTIGFPTANLSVPPEKLLPADGVYAVRVRWEDQVRPGVANLGVRPTFGEHHRVLEAHLIDFDGELYGKQVDIEFVARLRGELKFDSADALIAQIRLDVERARALL